MHRARRAPAPTVRQQMRDETVAITQGLVPHLSSHGFVWGRAPRGTDAAAPGIRDPSGRPTGQDAGVADGVGVGVGVGIGAKTPGHSAAARGYPTNATTSRRVCAMTRGMTRPQRR